MMDFGKVEEFIDPLTLNQEAMPEFASRFKIVDEEVDFSMSNSFYQYGNRTTGTQTRNENKVKKKQEKKRK